MKTLGKLQIKTEKLMKNEELATIRGGYGWTYCMKNSIPCGNMPSSDCGGASYEFCERVCPNWTSIACFGN
jgi:hypothetical protein